MTETTCSEPAEELTIARLYTIVDRLETVRGACILHPRAMAEAGASRSLPAKLARIARALARRLGHDLVVEARRPDASAEALQTTLAIAVETLGEDHALVAEIEARLDHARRAEASGDQNSLPRSD